MKLSEKYFEEVISDERASVCNRLDRIKTYGEICALEGKKYEAKRALKGMQKIIRLQEIGKQLKAITKKESL